MTEKRIKGHERRALIYELATGEKSQAELSRIHGVSRSAITAFRKRHTEDIEQAKQKLGEPIAGLWVTDRYNLLAELQEDVEQLRDSLDPNKMLRKHQAIKLISDLMGFNVQKIETTNKTHYTVEGVDLSELT